MRIVPPGESISKTPMRYAGYGEPKEGKTRLFTSLPDHWAKKIAYVAADPGAADLSSVLPKYRDRLHVVEPEAKRNERTGKLEYDPLAEAVHIATYDYAAEGFDALVWDTFTTTVEDIFEAISRQGVHGTTPVVRTKDRDIYVPQPAQGDYGAAQRSAIYITKLLFHQPIHLFVLFHSADDDSPTTETVGGPATVGRAGIRPMAKLFENLVRITSERKKIKDGPPPVFEKVRVVQTESKSYWLTGLRTPHTRNPMPRFELGEDPVEFWLALERALKGESL